MRITLAQLNPIVGDVEGNTRRAIETFRKVASETDLVVFSEMFLTGYPPQDLLERPRVIRRVEEALRLLCKISAEIPGVGILIGAPELNPKSGGRRLHNAAFLIVDGRIVYTQVKSLLPTYDVFDEARYFQPADKIDVVQFKGETLGISICEDAWTDTSLGLTARNYDTDPIGSLANKGASIILNLSASPFNVYKIKTRFKLLSDHSRKHGIPLVFVNQVGANDELIFDGHSLSFDKCGVPNAVLSGFVEEVVTIDSEKTGQASLFQARTEIATVHDALVLGLRDYAHKCGFTKAILGLSGGIDSAVTLALAVEALGAENMLGICMPSLYSSEGSITDSRKLAENYGVTMKTIPIENVYESYLDTLSPDMEPTEIGITQENLQARVRGNILMAYANKFGYLTLSTGNKSEMAVGYCTLYGDMSGGLSVLSDVPKTEVYNLAKYINCSSEKIPQEIIDKPPSAELRPNQADQDTLPSYEVLDRILHCYVEDRCSAEDLVSDEVPPEVIRWVVEAVDRNEYKRRQAPPGLRVTSKSFGSGRRMPIAAKYNQFGQYWQFGECSVDSEPSGSPMKDTIDE